MRIRISRNMFLPGGVPVRAGDVVDLTGDAAILVLTYGWGAAVVEPAAATETATSQTAATRQKAAHTGKAD